MTVIKSTTGYIFGAFTKVAWSSLAVHKSDATAFLFTLTNPANMPLKLNLKNRNDQYAVVHISGGGPTFGGVNDLAVSSESNTNTNSHLKFGSYEAPNRQTGSAGGRFIHVGSNQYFKTLEIEVFQVI